MSAYLTIPTLKGHFIKGGIDIETLYNIKVKKFGNEKQVIVYSKPVISGVPSPHKGKKKEQIIKKPKDIQEYKIKVLKSFRTAKIRSKNKIYDYSRSNEWDWFVTITFNPEKVNSFDYELVSKKLSQWLKDKRKRNCPNMKYLFVPELHKSGRYHFHGIMADCEGLEFTDSNKKTDTGDTIYNIGKYKLGFTTATRVKDSARVTKYIGKYITKELASMVKGKKRYWASRNCNIPDIEHYYNRVEFYDNDKKEYIKTDDVLRELHDNLISQDNFTYGSERIIKSDVFKENYIRYYEFEGAKTYE